MSRCVAERKYTQEQARKELQQVFIPECDEDGAYSQVTCSPQRLQPAGGGPGEEGGGSRGRGRCPGRERVKDRADFHGQLCE